MERLRVWTRLPINILLIAWRFQNGKKESKEESDQKESD
jgi:hypothetical protein